MKLQSTTGLLGMALLALAGCNNIERENRDVSTTAATLSADTLETMKLSAVTLNQEETLQQDTSITSAAVQGEPEETYTETEVVEVDTVSTRTVYDVRRRIVEEVDTVGATTTYEIKRTVLKRTVMLDTLTETQDKKQTVAFEKGNFKKLDEKVETDTVVEIRDYESVQQNTVQTPTQATQQSAQPDQTATQPQRSPATQSSSTGNVADTSATSAQPQSTTNAVDTSTTAVQPNATQPSRNDSNRTMKRDTTRQQGQTSTQRPAKQDTTGS